MLEGERPDSDEEKNNNNNNTTNNTNTTNNNTNTSISSSNNVNQDHLKQFVEQLAESQLQNQLKASYPASLLVSFVYFVSFLKFRCILCVLTLFSPAQFFQHFIFYPLDLSVFRSSTPLQCFLSLR